MSSTDEYSQLLEYFKRRLIISEQQIAHYGLFPPPSLLAEAQELRRIIAQMELQLESGAELSIDALDIPVWLHVTAAPIDQKPRPRALPPIPEGKELPAIGKLEARDHDVAWYRARLKADHLALITGEAGIGKTTLAACLAHEFMPAKNVCWYAFSEYDTVDGLLEELAAFLARHGQKQPWEVRHGDSGVLTANALIDQLVPLLRNGRYLLWLDDCQFARGNDEEALGRLIAGLYPATRAGTLSLLITSWYAPKGLPPTLRERDLPAFDAAGVAAIIAGYGLSLADAHVQKLFDATKGNAALLTLAANALAAGVVVDDLLDELETGEAVAYLFNSRVDALLSDHQRDVMSAVAVLQGSASQASIEAVRDAQASDLVVLRELQRRNLLTSSREARGEFKQNSILRSYYYGKVGGHELQLKHTRAATFFEARERDLIKAAHHALWASDGERAAKLIVGNFWSLMNQAKAGGIEPLLQQLKQQALDDGLVAQTLIASAEIATLFGDTDAALGDYQRAYTLLSRANDEPATRIRRARVLRGRAAGWERANAIDRAEQECLRGLELLEELPHPQVERARLCAQLASALLRRGDEAGVEKACTDGLAQLPPEPDAPRERLLLKQRLATLSVERQRYFEAVYEFQDCLKIALQANDPFLTVVLQNNLGAALDIVGKSEQALAYYEECLATQQSLGDLVSQVATRNNIGAIFLKRGDYSAAQANFDRAIAMCDQLGLRAEGARPRLNTGIRAFCEGELPLARARTQEALAAFLAASDRADALVWLGDIALAEGNPEQALGYGAQILALFADNEDDDIGNVACAHRLLGEALLMKHDLDGANTQLATAWDLLSPEEPDEIDVDPSDQARIRLAQARLAEAQVRPAQAREYALEAQELIAGQDEHFLAAQIAAFLAHLGSSDDLDGDSLQLGRVT